MSNTTKWIIGVVVVLIVMLALPFLWQALFPNVGFGMMGYRHAPMMGGYGYGFMPFGMIFMGLIPLSLLVLIGLGIAALIKYLKS